jgi:hypothetical protein
MERFVRRENIKRYRKLLLEAKDEAERRLIQKLLMEEEQKRTAAGDALACDRAALARSLLLEPARSDGQRLRQSGTDPQVVQQTVMRVPEMIGAG